MKKVSINKEQIVREFGDKISSLSHRMIWNSELAKEAAQEVWFEILKSLDKFNGESELSTYIYIIAKRTILRYAKSERIIKDCEIDNHFNLESIAYQGDEKDKKEWVKEKCDYCLTAFCHCLTNEARLVFLFRDIAGLSDVQISNIMDLKIDNIRKIASRSKEKVKRFMKKDCILMNPLGNCRCRIRKQIKSVQLDREYERLSEASRLIDLFKKFDRELPRKNYWEKFITELVTE